MSAEDTSPETGGLQGAGVPATLPSPPNVNGGVMLHSLTYGVVEGAVETGGKKKLKVRACAHCAESHAACNEERPCERCKKRGFECVDKPSKRPLKQMRTPKNANKLPSQANYDPFLTHMAAGYAQPTPESVDYYRRATAPVTHTPHAHGHAAHGHVQYSVAPGSGYDAYARTSGASQTSYFPYAPPTLPSSSAPGSFFPSAPPPPNFPHAHGAAYAPYAPISLQGDAYPPASPPAYAQWPPSASLSAASGAVAAAPGAAAPPAVHPASAPLLPGSGVVGGASASAGAGGSVDVGGDTHRAFLPFKGVRRKPVVFAGTYNQREAAVELAPSTSVADLRALVQERLGAQDEELLLTYMRGGDRVVVHDETDLDQLLANPHLGEIELFVKRGRLAPTTFPASGDS